MPSEIPSQQPDLNTAVNQAPTSEEEGPEVSILKIQEIVKTLQSIFPLKQPEKLRPTQSNVGPSTLATPTSPRPTLTKAPSAPPAPPNKDESENSIHRLKRNLFLLEADVKKIRELNTDVADEVKKHIIPLDKLLKKVEAQSVNAKLTEGMKKDVEEINKKIFKLMCDVPLLPNKRRKPGGVDSEAGDGDNNGKGIFCLHGIHAYDEYLKTRAVYRYVEDEFKKLSDTPLLQICLLSFAVFPENQEVNRTMLMYWWIGEGILPVIGAEDGVKKILKEFMDKNLIEAVENKRKVEPNSYKMSPFVHSSVVLISEEIKLFDMYQKGEKPRMKESKLHKVCLVDGSSSQAEAKAKKMPAAEIETVFNVSERFPDFTFKWFSEEQPSRKKMIRLKKIANPELKVFYLGRWERTAKRHIEIENPEYMKYLKHMTKLRLLSFQGISRIERLDDAVCKLHELIILDLRACYNLEKLPDKINSLKELIYLDITDCYMIDRMPKRLSWLVNLEVLKGFVVSDAHEDTVCTLAELQELTKLRKLSITINNGDFSVTDLFRAIEGFKNLEKLKVAWGSMNEHNKKDATGGVQDFLERTATYILRTKAAAKQTKKNQKPEKPKLPPVLPKSLKKLDLQCFPDAALPPWLEPEQLGDLEKFYIKGGKDLTGFGKSLPDKPTNCKVKVLRLKFLPRLKVEWRDLKELYFPNLKFLDKYQCPQVSLCPCDGNGIWRSPCDGIGIWRSPEKHQV